jgi:hypothetical protein
VVRVYRTQMMKAKASALFGIFPSLAGEEGGKEITFLTKKVLYHLLS